MTPPANRILLIEDDQGLARSISVFLTSNGFLVKHLTKAENLSYLITAGGIDLILCDVMLPGTSGFDLVKEIRNKYSGPYIFISALFDKNHQLKGFELGADDYIGKPFEPDLLLARINACLRRKNKKINDEKIEINNLFIDNINRLVKISENKISLSRYEFDLLWLLASRQGQLVSREYLFLNTVGREYDGLDRTIDGRVSRLRKKLETYSHLNCQIETVWGQGYILSKRS